MNDFFHSPYHPLRPLLLMRATYVLLAGDLWLGMVQHGGRYGLDGFNVAHFAWLDALLPDPGPGLYVALLLFSGGAALSLGLFSQPRWLRAALALTYTLAWMISIHDSYQHHYFISWLLAWCVAMPTTELDDREPVVGWGVPMAAMTCAIVYAFTGIAKSEAAWRSGDVLRALAQPGDAPSPADSGPAWLHTLVPPELLWGAFAYATIALQWTIALGYLLSVHRDARTSRVRVALVSLGLLGAIMFHASAELFGHFEIGVFSYYMLALAVVLLAPAIVLEWIARGLTELRSAAVTRVWSGQESAVRLLVLVVLLALIGLWSPLPGALAASCVLAAVTALRLWRAARTPERDTRRLALQAAFCGLLLWLALTQTSMVFDYYRRVAGELRKMGRPADALEAYRIAEHHAPRGQSRAGEIRKLERELHRQVPPR